MHLQKVNMLNSMVAVPGHLDRVLSSHLSDGGVTLNAPGLYAATLGPPCTMTPKTSVTDGLVHLLVLIPCIISGTDTDTRNPDRLEMLNSSRTLQKHLSGASSSINVKELCGHHCTYRWRSKVVRSRW